MNKYSIQVENGKVIGDSAFFRIANDLLDNEIKRLCDFTAVLDKELLQKKEKIAEYKCAKYRYASVARIYNFLWHGNRVYHKPAIHVDIENCIKNNKELLELCNNAPDSEKIDYKLYYGISFIADEMSNSYSKGLSNAGDWEKIELEERIDGLKFAKECLDEAWQRRKEVIQ